MRGWLISIIALLALALGPASCGEDDVKTTGQRGIPGGAKKKKDDGKSKRRRTSQAATPVAAGEDGGEEVDPGPERPELALDQQSFARRRDPFRSFVVTERQEPEPDAPRAARKVKLAQYGFEDLKLVTIVTGGRSIRPRALFVGGDGRSKNVLQGEYFSSAEVLLAAVNRDYVEIEVVDEELAEGLGMRRGERRAIYLRNE